MSRSDPVSPGLARSRTPAGSSVRTEALASRVRLLVTSFPGLGHLHPLVPLARCAVAAGHEVRVATGPDLSEWVEACGLEAWPVGLALTEAVAAAERDFPGPEMVEHLFTDVWVRRAVPDLLGLTEGWRPDLVVHEEEEYAGVLLAAIRDVPCVTQSWAAPARPEAGRRSAQRLLDPIWRGHLGSTAARRVGELYLDACPPPFQAARDLADLARGTTVVSVRPGTWDGPASDPPAFLADLPHPAAYVTLGTVPGFSTPERLTHLVEALQDEFASLVVTTGPNPDTVLEGHPAHVHVSGYLSQSQVLSKVDVLVSHGGAGGTVGALVHGLPHLVVAGDGQSQQTIAASVQRLGLGLAMSPVAPAPDLRAAAARLVTDPSFRAAALEQRDLLLSLPGERDILGRLEQLPATGRTIG